MSQNRISGYARGWFVVAFASELAPGKVLSRRYFGQQLVLFRGESGKVAVLDAYCPHLGADLGLGGDVVGDTIRCPFHAWRFGCDGVCTDIPYATRIPKQAMLKSWPVREVNGLIMVWHHPRGAPPDWEVPIIPEYGSAEWTPWNADNLRVRTQPREIVENVADKAHFPIVHGTHVEAFENTFDGHTATQRTRGVAYPRGGGEDKFALTATYYGPAYQITEMDGVLKNKLLLAHTPVDETCLDLRFGVSLKVFGSSEKMARFADGYITNLRTGFHEDLRIWENKAWRGVPVLCDGDGPLGRLRAWYAQFYEETP